MDTISQAVIDAENSDPIYQQEKIGLDAAQIQQAYPELVTTGSDGYLRVDYIGLIPVLISAMKEQNDIIKAQSDKIAALEKSVVALSPKNPR
ncbi:MAG: hypothetical protein HC905_25060 [Bacteroidales bacterium]|nr:hypothetical protein [Bacteroidales bacterium]